MSRKGGFCKSSTLALGLVHRGHFSSALLFLSLQTPTHIHVPIHVCMHPCPCTHPCPHTHPYPCTHPSVRSSIRACGHPSIFMHPSIRACIHQCTLTSIRVSVHTLIHLCICAPLHSASVWLFRSMFRSLLWAGLVLRTGKMGMELDTVQEVK